MRGECNHIGLFSRNPEALIRFYTEKMDFEQLGSKTISKEWMTQIFGMPAPCQLIKLRLGSVVLEIFVSGSKKLKGRFTPSEGYNHWGLGVEDKEAFIHKMERRGVPVLKLEGDGRFIYFLADPDGNLIEIYEK